MRIEHDNWLATIFGYAVFKVTLAEPSDVNGSSTLQAEVESTLSPGTTAFYYAKVPTQQVHQMRALTGLGFNVIDVNVTFDRKPPIAPAKAAAPAGRDIIVCDIRPAHHNAILDIAASCFVFTRFHLDPQIPDAVASTTKRAWLENYVAGRRGEKLLVAFLEDKPVGFLAVLRTQYNGAAVGVIDLIGVDKAYQGRGVGRSLVQHFMDESSEQYDLLRVGTQVANIPSMRLYEHSGFRVAETAYVLHGHVKDGAWQR